MKNADEGSAPTTKKMSFAPGWARSSSVGLVRSTSLTQPGGNKQAASGAGAGGQSQGAAQGLMQSSSTGPTPTPNSSLSSGLGVGGMSAVAALTAERKAVANLGQQEGSAVSNLAPIGRVALTGRSGKLTEQANLYHQQTKSPKSPLTMAPNATMIGGQKATSSGGGGGGAPRIRYSRDELLLYHSPTHLPNFPAHFNASLISPESQEPSFYEPFDRDSFYRDWQIECEKRDNSHPRTSTQASNNGSQLTADRRTSRGRRSDNMIGGETPSDPSQRAGRGFNTTNNWRSGTTTSTPSKDGPGRFGGLMRGSTEKDNRWGAQNSSLTQPGATTTPGSRWSNLPASSDRRDSRGGENGTPSRWDKLGRSNGPGFGRTSSSGDPSRDNLESNRWRRNPGTGSSAFGSYSSGQDRGFDELHDDHGTFSDSAMDPGGLGLDSMAEAAERFHAEMEEARRKVQDGLTLTDADDRSSAELFGLVAGGGLDDDILNAPLEEGLDQPPEEETVPPEEAIDSSGGSGTAPDTDPLLDEDNLGLPEKDDWSRSNPWVANPVQPAQAIPSNVPQNQGWVVPPTNIPPASMQMQQPSLLQQPPLPPQLSHLGQLQQPPPPLPHISDEWFYQDPQLNVQGPFKSDEMREWLDHGYFSMDLMVRRGSNEPFTPLGQRFPDPRKAFSLEAEAERERQMLMMQRTMMLQQQPQAPQPFFWGGMNPMMSQPNPLQQQQLILEQQMRQQEEEDRKRTEEFVRKQEEEERARQLQIQLLEQEEAQRRKVEAERRAAMEAEQRRHLEEEEKRKAVIAAQQEAERRQVLIMEEDIRRRAIEEEERRQIEEMEARALEEEEARAAEERRKAEEKPAWGGVAIAPPSNSKLSLKEIQEMEEREARKQRPVTGAVSSGSMAARIAHSAGMTAVRLSPSNAAQQQVPSAVSPVASQQTQANAFPLPVATAPTVAPTPVPEEAPAPPVSASGATLSEMSVDLRALLNIGGTSSKKQPTKTPEKPAWGAAAQQSQSAKSLKQIQEEEARRLRMQNANSQGQPRASTGWASRAAPGGGNSSDYQQWQSDAQNPAMASQGEPRGWSVGKSGNSADGGDHSPNDDSVDGEESNFGGKQMTGDMKRWCESQLEKLGATMTLIEFCFTLEDASDIREYLRDYLGSTPQVSAFATEFIQRKKGRAFTGEDGADASGFIPAKKNKKKKKPTA